MKTWIKINSDEKPEINEKVFVFIPGVGFETARYDGESFSKEGVLFWAHFRALPLPFSIFDSDIIIPHGHENLNTEQDKTDLNDGSSWKVTGK